MAKEKFLIIASRMMDDCFGRFSETENRANLSAGCPGEGPYDWIESSYEIRLVRYREATHICSFTPSAYFVWMANVFVGKPNAAWEADADPHGLEIESGGEWHGYGTYYDEYSPAVICDTFTVDTVKALGMRKPRASEHLGDDNDRLEKYHRAIWKYAEEAAHDIGCNGGFWAPGLDVFAFRQHERSKTISSHLTA